MRKERELDRRKVKGTSQKDRDLYDEDLDKDVEVSREKKSGVRFHRKRTLKEELMGK